MSKAYLESSSELWGFVFRSHCHFLVMYPTWGKHRAGGQHSSFHVVSASLSLVGWALDQKSSNFDFSFPQPTCCVVSFGCWKKNSCFLLLAHQHPRNTSDPRCVGFSRPNNSLWTPTVCPTFDSLLTRTRVSADPNAISEDLRPPRLPPTSDANYK